MSGGSVTYARQVYFAPGLTCIFGVHSVRCCPGAIGSLAPPGRKRRFSCDDWNITTFGSWDRSCRRSSHSFGGTWQATIVRALISSWRTRAPPSEPKNQ